MDKSIVDSIYSELNGEGKSLSRLLNALALLHEALGEGSWVGIYLYDENANNLFLGPFQGSPACEFIQPGKGVVGSSYAAKRPMYVSDVSKFPGYISCDARAKSEAVYPMKVGEDVIGILDIDSPIIDGLKNDLDILDRVAEVFASFC